MERNQSFAVVLVLACACGTPRSSPRASSAPPSPPPPPPPPSAAATVAASVKQQDAEPLRFSLAEAPAPYPLFAGSPDERFSAIAARVEPGGRDAIAVIRHDGAQRTVIRVLAADPSPEAGFLDGTLLWRTLDGQRVLYDVATEQSARTPARSTNLLLTHDGKRLVGLDWTARKLFVLRRESLQPELTVELPAKWQENVSWSLGPLRWIVPDELVLVPRDGGVGVVDLTQRAATGEASATDALILPDPAGTVALLSAGDSSPGWRASVWNARTGQVSRPVVLGPGAAVLHAASKGRFIALTLSDVEGRGRVDLHVLDGQSGQRVKTVPGNRVDWGGFLSVAITDADVVCASHTYPMRGGTCEATPLFDLRSMSVARPPPGVRCVVRDDDAGVAVVGSAAPGRTPIDSGGYWGGFGDVCNQALSADGRLFARVESTPGWSPTSAPAQVVPSILGHDLHLAVFDARNGQRRLDVPLGDPPGNPKSLWLEFVSDTVVAVSTAFEMTWRVDIATGTVVQGPGVLRRRGPSARWAWAQDQEPVLFDFESGNVIPWPWWTDVAEGALKAHLPSPVQ